MIRRLLARRQHRLNNMCQCIAIIAAHTVKQHIIHLTNVGIFSNWYWETLQSCLTRHLVHQMWQTCFLHMMFQLLFHRLRLQWHLITTRLHPWWVFLHHNISSNSIKMTCIAFINLNIHIATCFSWSHLSYRLTYPAHYALVTHIFFLPFSLVSFLLSKCLVTLCCCLFVSSSPCQYSSIPASLVSFNCTSFSFAYGPHHRLLFIKSKLGVFVYMFWFPDVFKRHLVVWSINERTW